MARNAEFLYFYKCSLTCSMLHKNCPICASISFSELPFKNAVIVFKIGFESKPYTGINLTYGFVDYNINMHFTVLIEKL